MRQVLSVCQLQPKSVLTLMISQYLGQNVPSDISFGVIDEFPEGHRHVSIATSQPQHLLWCLANSGRSVSAKGKDEVLALPQRAERS